MQKRTIILLLMLPLIAMMSFSSVQAAITPVVIETGFISLSIDGLGTNNAMGSIIQVEKPSGATVRSAYLAAASMGISGRQLVDGDVKIDGVDVIWDIGVHFTTVSGIDCWNHWADVTSIVKPTIDAAPVGRVDFTITEIDAWDIDGEILAVIFDDPNQITSNTIFLLFGTQSVDGDTFTINFVDPLGPPDPSLIMDFSLGIGYGFQGFDQYSIVDVNGIRLSTSAGGQDDGGINNGELLTVGGLDDSNANPADPYATPVGDPRIDDELYDLLPFTSPQDTSVVIFTQNPSEDDNIFFAALFLTVAAQIGPVVGGEILPVNTLQLLAPYLLILGLAATIFGVGLFKKKRLP